MSTMYVWEKYVKTMGGREGGHHVGGGREVNEHCWNE